MEELIENLPEYLSVLDIGAGGLYGVNTTDVLIKHFADYTGICKTEVNSYLAQCEEKGLGKPNIIIGDYYQHNFGRQFDLVVHDLDIGNNIKDWENEFGDIPLKDKGYLITYIMMTTEYGNKDTSNKIRRHWQEFWGVDNLNNKAIGKRKIKNYEFLRAMREKRRPYITWIMLQKTIHNE